MKSKVFVFTLGLWLLAVVAGFGVTAEDILQKLDANEGFKTMSYAAKMTIDKGGKKLVKDFYGYSMKEGDKFFMAYTNSADMGVKYLKLNNELWIYLPDAGDTLKISGHMLRQGMMGSDLSYEDMLNADDYKSTYKAKLIGSTNYGGIDSYVLELVAVKDTATYYKQILIVDKARFVFLQQELYAKSGRYLKKMVQSDFKQIGSRYYGMKLVIEDMTRKNSVTTLEFLDLKFDVAMPQNVFSLQNLSR